MTRKRYENIDQIKNNHTFLDFIKWYKERMVKKKDLSETIAITKSPSFKNIHMEKFNSITWIGHATFFNPVKWDEYIDRSCVVQFYGDYKTGCPKSFPCFKFTSN